MLQGIDPLYSIARFGVGMLVGLTGVGGGFLMAPLLILLFGTEPITAVGTDLFYASATKAAGSLVHGLSGTINWRIVRRLALGSVPTTALTMLALGHLDMKSTAVGELISIVLAGALFLTGLTLAFRERILRSLAPRMRCIDARRTAAFTIGVGAILGTLVSVSSVGAGAIGVTALILLYPELPSSRIVGSDIPHAVPLTLAAGLGHWFLGNL